MIGIEGQPILTAAAMKAAELASGIDLFTLMTRAGEGVATAVARLAAGREVLILCGPGNNGGNGYVAAALLRRGGIAVRVAASAEPATDLARRARAGWDGPVELLADAAPAPVVVDALFGTGLSRPLDDGLATWLHRLVDAAQLAVAVDLPSGVATDDGACLSDPPSFHLTLALGALKPAHLLHPPAARCGAVRLLPIGIEAESDLAVLAPPRLTPPGWDAHKFTRGLVVVIAGAMPGAGALAATAAARAGAGYVLLLGSATDRLPHAIVRRRWSRDMLTDERIGAVLIGPGLGRDDAARAKLAAALDAPHPLVLDGDALAFLEPAQLKTRTSPTVLTPHAGEFARLFGEGQGSRIDRARAAAAASGAAVVLKGADTAIARPDGQARIATTGPTWLSTAGTGDVLAGIVAARLAAGRDAFDAAGEGVWLHAEAARRAGPAFVADDLAAHLPAAIAACL